MGAKQEVQAVHPGSRVILCPTTGLWIVRTTGRVITKAKTLGVGLNATSAWANALKQIQAFKSQEEGA